MGNFNVNGNIGNIQNETNHSSIHNHSNNQSITITELQQIKEEIQASNKFWGWMLGVISGVVSGVIILVLEKYFFK